VTLGVALDVSDSGQLFVFGSVPIFDVSLPPELADMLEVPGNLGLIHLHFPRKLAEAPCAVQVSPSPRRRCEVSESSFEGHCHLSGDVSTPESE
jgi:hypothetical protein